MRERLAAIKPKQTVVTVDGMRFRVTGLPTSKKNDLLAQQRDSRGKAIPNKANGLVLSACVSDDESGEPIFGVDEWQQWGDLPSHITGPLISECIKILGLDDDDGVEREVKNSGATGS